MPSSVSYLPAVFVTFFLAAAGISRAVMESGIVGYPHQSPLLTMATTVVASTTRSTATANGVVVLPRFLKYEHDKKPSDEKFAEIEWLVFPVNDKHFQTSLNNREGLALAKSIEKFSELSFVSPENYKQSAANFNQFGGLAIPYGSVKMEFHNCTVQVLNSEQSNHTSSPEQFLTAHPQTELSPIFEMTSEALELIPLKYRCKIMNSQRLTTWDAVMMAWKMRNTRTAFTDYLINVKKLLAIGNDEESQGVSTLRLLAQKDFELNLDGSTLELQRAVVATRKIKQDCPPAIIGK
ncbi:hypothetical protein V1514DRAFT_325824 [Lipomyces japonicus]|uniref:uncharacterized protein n=1 Tax=Lipomyces japonicus TaxID=56871 RepID=UPI0034CD3317